jgi:glycerol-3-phosphate cytidylyltransferase
MHRIGFTCGAWDLFHPGHVLHLEEAKAHCQVLLVGLHVDPSIERPGFKNRPLQTVFERYIQLQGCRYIDQIIPYETNQDLLNILSSQHIDIRFLDEWYSKTPEKIVGKQACLLNGIDLHYTRREHQYSSTELRNRIYASNQNTIKS